LKAKYEQMVEGNQCIESSLHGNLIEHLNNEVVLRTITNMSVAIDWLKSTYLYIRLKKNPTHYGAKPKLTEQQMDAYLAGYLHCCVLPYAFPQASLNVCLRPLPTHHQRPGLHRAH
jgi:hypothetical protein